MGYGVCIGEGTFGIVDPEVPARWRVRKQTLLDAPAFPHMLQRVNCFSGSHIWFDGFLENTGMNMVFPDDAYGRVYIVTQEMVDRTQSILRAYNPAEKLPPGFTGLEGPRYDGWLAALIWFDFWLRWALQTCQNPIVTFN